MVLLAGFMTQVGALQTGPMLTPWTATGTTKADVIGFHAAVATVMLPHLIGRPATRKR